MASQCLCPRTISKPRTTPSYIFSYQVARAFNSSPSLNARPHKTNPLSLLPASAPPPPPYPYPRRTWYKQADHGLYGGTTIQFGNNVSSKNEIKTRRVWRPNTQYKNLYSESLQRMLRLRVSTRVLRTIDKVGGLDNYVLGTSAQRVKELGEDGWKLRWAVLHSPTVQERMSTSETLRRMVEGRREDVWAREEEITSEEAEENGIEFLADDEGSPAAGQKVEETFMSEATRANR